MPALTQTPTRTPPLPALHHHAPPTRMQPLFQVTYKQMPSQHSEISKHASVCSTPNQKLWKQNREHTLLSKKPLV